MISCSQSTVQLEKLTDSERIQHGNPSTDHCRSVPEISRLTPHTGILGAGDPRAVGTRQLQKSHIQVVAERFIRMIMIVKLGSALDLPAHQTELWETTQDESGAQCGGQVGICVTLF